MELTVEVEKPSTILRKFTIKVPAQEIKKEFERRIIQIQKTADLKGFRRGFVPLSVVKQFYGDDVRHRLYHSLIDDSLDQVIREHKIKAVGSPKIDRQGELAHSHEADHVHGDASKEHIGEHQHEDDHSGHSLQEDQDLTYTATLEVIPEIQAKNYTGVSLQKDKTEVTDEQVEKVIENLRDMHSELVPATGGIILEGGTESSRSVQKGDFVDFNLSADILVDDKKVPCEDLSGNQVLEIGSGSWIPGFEEQVVGLRRNETKTFQLSFPKDFPQVELAEKTAEFTVTVNEIKEKKLPEVNDAFAQQAGASDLAAFKAQVREYLTAEQTKQSEKKLRAALMKVLLEKNSFEVPEALIQGQVRVLAEDWAKGLEEQGFNKEAIQERLKNEFNKLREIAEGQVRASLLLDSIAREEKISVSQEEIDEEIKSIAQSVKAELEKVKEFYAKNPGRIGELEFNLRQERTIKFLLEKAKIKLVAPTEK